MSLAATYKAGAGNPWAKPCKIVTIRDALPTDEAGVLDLMLGDADWSGDRISQALRPLGHRIAGQTIDRHRRGRCLCEPR